MVNNLCRDALCLSEDQQLPFMKQDTEHSILMGERTAHLLGQDSHRDIEQVFAVHFPDLGLYQVSGATRHHSYKATLPCSVTRDLIPSQHHTSYYHPS